jgi:CheY-like chemotaxis protein
LGLGLSIVKHLAELHGGAVRAKSPGEGKGSTFVVVLPLLVMHDEAEEAGAHPQSRADGDDPCTVPHLRGVKVLVVDDEPDARDLVKRFLERCQAEVMTAGSAEEAMRGVRDFTPDVIVSDIGMPSKDGYQFIREVRRLGPADGGRIPAIALTAFARSEDRTRSLLAGYQVHLSKPIESPELVAAVASLAGRTGT